MKFKLLGFLMTIFNFSKLEDVPISDGELNLDDDQNSQLKEFLGNDYENYMKGLNKEIELKESQEKLEKNEKLTQELKQEISEAVNALDLSGDDKQKALDDDNPDINLSAEIQNLKTELSNLKNEKKTLQGQVNQLSKLDDFEPPTIQTRNFNKPMKHSATHLFSSGNSWDSLENDKRFWNLALANSKGNVDLAVQSLEKYKRADDIAPYVETLNTDINNYFIENPKVLKDLSRSRFGLFPHWKKRTGVIDVVQTSGHRVGNDLTQARRSGWKPKGGWSIEVEQGQVYAIQVDTEIMGQKLMELAETWLQGMLMKPDSGSYEQESFVRFLLGLYNPKREEEDTEALFNAIYSEIPEHLNAAHSGKKVVQPGSKEHRQNGLKWLLWFYRFVTKQIKGINVGMVPTEENIPEYLEQYISKFPIELIKKPFQHYISWNLFVALSKSKALSVSNGNKHQVVLNLDDLKNFDFLKESLTITGYPNHKVYTHPYLGNTKHIFSFMDGDEPEIMENKPEEKAKWKIEKFLRDWYLFLDYKIGIRFEFVGPKNVPDTDPNKLFNQFVFTNDQPIFGVNDKVKIYDFLDGKLKSTYNNIYVDSGWQEDVNQIFFRSGKRAEEISFPKGMIVSITGNESISGTPKVKKNVNLLLASDFDLKTAGTLTLYSNGDGTYKELKRTSEAPVISSSATEFELDIVNADENTEFAFTGTDAVTLAQITGGHDGKVIKLLGNTDAVLTLESNDYIQVDATTTIGGSEANAAMSIELINAGGMWFIKPE